jgi:hypothetical protein
MRFRIEGTGKFIKKLTVKEFLKIEIINLLPKCPLEKPLGINYYSKGQFKRTIREQINNLEPINGGYKL